MRRPHLTVTRDLGRTAGELIAMSLDDAVSNRGRAVLAVPGGGSPKPVFQWLARHLDAHVHERLVVTFVDERHLPDTAGLPPDQLPDESNLKGAWQAWFQHRSPEVVPLIHGGTVHEAAAALSPVLEALGPPDVCLLGFGPDGHVASLFPGHPGLGERGPVVAIQGSPKPPPERLTLSLPWLRQAFLTVAIGSGASKRAAAADVLTGPGALPLALAHPRARWHLVLDPDAAPTGDPS